MEWLTKLIKSLDTKDFAEVVALMTITTCFFYMFMVTFVPLIKQLPKESHDVSMICLGYMFALIKDLFKYYFDIRKPENLSE